MRHSDFVAAYGPPDKEQHFRGESSKKITSKGSPGLEQHSNLDEDFIPASKKIKTQPVESKPKIGGLVKAKYDEEWFQGTLIAYNSELDEWTMHFLKTIALTMSPSLIRM